MDLGGGYVLLLFQVKPLFDPEYLRDNHRRVILQIAAGVGRQEKEAGPKVLSPATV
jgi:hypothetical protein